MTPDVVAAKEMITEGFAALNRNDIAAMAKDFDPEIEWITPIEFPEGGTYGGFAEVYAHIVRSRESWAEGSCEAKNLYAADDKIVVDVAVRARLKQETEWRVGTVGDVYTFRDGRVVQVRTFSQLDAALAWAGVKTAVRE